MNDDIWVTSELGNGSQFYFTTESLLSDAPLESVIEKLHAFQDRTILVVDTHNIGSSLLDCIEELDLKAIVLSDIQEIPTKEKCPTIDTIIVDSIESVGAQMHSLDLILLLHRPRLLGSWNISAIFLW